MRLSFIINKKKLLKTVSLLSSLLLLAGVPFSASAAENRTENRLEGYGGTCDVTRLDLPEGARRVVVVEADGLMAKVSMFGIDADAKGEGKYSLIMTTDSGFIGRKGMGKTGEGDEKTPYGIFKMNTPFGISEKREGFPDNYIKINSTHYWNGDSASPLYNKLVSTDVYNDFNKSKSEHLINYGGYYNYCIDTGYNPEGTPYAGSAIFLHCSMGINTGGCIAIPEESMVTVLQNYIEGGTYIVLDTKGGFEKYYKAEEAKQQELMSEEASAENFSGAEELSEAQAAEAANVEPSPKVIYAPSAQK